MSCNHVLADVFEDGRMRTWYNMMTSPAYYLATNTWPHMDDVNRNASQIDWRIERFPKGANRSVQDATDLSFLRVRSQQQASWKVKHYVVDPERDIVLLYVPSMATPFADMDGFRIGDCHALSLGAAVHAWGYPRSWNGTRPLLFSGSVSHPAGWKHWLSGKLVQHVVLNMDIHHGCSGGPVFDDAQPDVVLGVVVWKHKDTSVDSWCQQAIKNSPGEVARVGNVGLFECFRDIADLHTATQHLGIGEAVALDDDYMKRLWKGEALPRAKSKD